MATSYEFSETCSPLLESLNEVQLSSLSKFYKFYLKFKENPDPKYPIDVDKYLFPDEELKAVSICKRFLIARDYDVAKAEKLFIEAINLRNSVKSWRIYTDDTLGILKDDGAEVYVCDTGLRDDNNRPITVGKVTIIDGKKILQREHVDAMATFIELMALKNDPAIFGAILILDQKIDVKNRHKPPHVLSTLKEAFHTANTNFPEVVHQIIIINASLPFRILWKIASLWLSSRTLEKILILGSNYETELFKHLDPKLIFKCFGGSYDFGPTNDQELREYILENLDKISMKSMQQYLSEV